jgi:hypothetical protein
VGREVNALAVVANRAKLIIEYFILI